jgi:hypothetical protein
VHKWRACAAASTAHVYQRTSACGGGPNERTLSMLRTAQEKLIELAFICVIATATLVGWVVVRGVQKATDARADVAFGCVIVAAVLAAWVKWVLYVWGEEKRLAVEAERHDIGIPIDLTTRPRMAATRKAVKNGAGLQAHDQTRARHVEQVAEITQQLRSTFNDLELGGTPPGPSNRPPEVGVGFGRIGALYCHSSASHRIPLDKYRYLYF